MDIDRKLQREILLKLKQAYPKGKIEDWLYWRYIHDKDFPTDTHHERETLLSEPKDNPTWQHLKDNVAYLIEHGLITYTTENGAVAIKATVKGVDFVENDGGLSSVLNTVCVSYHTHTWERLGELLHQLDKPTLQELMHRLPTEIALSLIQAFPALGLATMEYLSKRD